MSELIDRNVLKAKMYQEAFESDTDMQKWDSGCWIRYKLFEKVVDSTPTVPYGPRWHRVEEPPKGHGPYLCASKSKLQDGQTYWFFTLCWYADGDLKDVVWDAEKESGFYNWSESQDREIDSRVDYWMPIDPPKEDA